VRPDPVGPGHPGTGSSTADVPAVVRGPVSALLVLARVARHGNTWKFF
jgi:hypothetical protein